MSISVVKDKGMHVVTVQTDDQSVLPPLSHTLKALCFIPAWCSVRKAMMCNVVGSLGAVQIMVGLFNIGLGPGRTSIHPDDFTSLGAAYWLGAVFISAGIVSILADSCPYACLVGFSVFMNIVGSILAIVGIVLYAIDLSESSIMWLCDGFRSDDNCRYVAYFFQRLLTGMDASLMALAVLQLSTCIGLAVVGIRALCYRKEKGVGDADTHQPLLKEVLMTSPGA